MKKKILFPILILGGLFCLQITQSSCTNDKLPDDAVNPACETLMPTYDNQVKPIIDASCAVAGCHVSGAPFGDFSTYAMMTPFLNDSQFKQEVLIDETMPVPPASLTAEELEIMECWITNNYAEN